MLAKGLHPLSAICKRGAICLVQIRTMKLREAVFNSWWTSEQEETLLTHHQWAVFYPWEGRCCVLILWCLVFLDLRCGWCFEPDWVRGGRVTVDEQGGPTEDHARTQAVQHLDLGEAQ